MGSGSDKSSTAGYVGDCHQSLRLREVFKYWQPTVSSEKARHVDPFLKYAEQNNEYQPNLVSSYDAQLAVLTNLTARLLNVKRAMVMMIAGQSGYVVAESTQTLSITAPHTHAPGDQLWLGAGTIFPSAGSLCELAVCMHPPNPDLDQPFLTEVKDLGRNEAYRCAAFVTDWPHTHFYGAVPLRTKNGVSIGTLCVMDPSPKPQGFTDEEKVTLSHMGDIVMDYLVMKQGERDVKKSKAMEMGLSRFIAEGFLPGEGVEMTERRDGRLLGLDMLEERRRKEMERKKKVEEKRLMFQERRFAEMMLAAMKEREKTWQKGQESLHIGRPTSAGGCCSSSSGRNDERNRRKTVMGYRQACTPSIVQAEDDEEGQETTGLSLMETMILSSENPLPTPAASPYSGYKTMVGSGGDSYFLTPPASNSNLHSGSSDDTNYFDSGQSSSSESAPRRKSAYEKTSTFEPQFRAMFFRAASLIRNAIDADVVFLDGDLEGFFGPDECGRPHSCGVAHISTDKFAEQATRAERPKSCRRRSGILGYATAGGSSNHWGRPGNSCRHDTVEQLGFDVGELSEDALNELVEENAQGRIVAHVDGVLPSEEADGSRTDAILRRFLPGAKSVILVPLFDHNRKLFAVCFAWTTSATRTFCGDVEGSFVTAVANCIMAETTRLNILNADKAKGEFISSISHELRTPIHGILASADFLAESPLDQYQQGFVDTIVSCGRTLLDTINHVLDFQKLNSLSSKFAEEKLKNGAGPENTETAKIETDLSALVQDIMEGVCLGFQFQSHTSCPRAETLVTKEDGSRITVIVDIQHREDGWVFLTHPAALKRVINNLAGNAMKYTEAGWVRVRLSAEDMEPDVHGNKRARMILSVSDSGKGISREFLKTKLFTPFSQENPLAAGAGLGMSIVRQIVGGMTGEIDVKSQVGKGTNVIVSVPLIHRRTIPNPDPSIHVRRRTAGLKVCMIGFPRFSRPETEGPMEKAADHLRRSVEKYLWDYFEMRVTKDDANEPDVVIVNDSQGEQVLDGLARNGPPVIVLCSHPPMDGGASRRFGRAVTFVRKPAGPKKLATAMAFCLEEMHNYQCSDTESDYSDYETADESYDTEDEDAEKMRDNISTPPPSDSWPSDNENLSPRPKKRLPTVLAVEDNKINLMLLTTFLKRKGYPFEVASDGLEALQKVKAKEKDGGYDVILMDLQMPVMGGIESTREIRRFEEESLRRKKSLVIALTGLAAVSDQREAYEAGVDSFMVKPVSFRALQRTLDEEGFGVSD